MSDLSFSAHTCINRTCAHHNFRGALIAVYQNAKTNNAIQIHKTLSGASTNDNDTQADQNSEDERNEQPL